MLRDGLLILSLLGAGRGWLFAVRCAQSRFRAGPETARKMLHVAMGLTLTALPWLFDSVPPVAVLCATLLGLLIATPYVPLLDRHVTTVIHGVRRRGVGEFLFPASALALFVLARGTPALFVGPMLVLTLADAAAALVGQRYGMMTYRAPGGRKSVEGSLAFAAVAFAAVHLSLLLLGDGGRAESVLIATVAAVVLAVVEAVSARGFDNVLVPLGAWGLVRGLAGLPPEWQTALAAGSVLAGVVLVAACAARADPLERSSAARG